MSQDALSPLVEKRSTLKAKSTSFENHISSFQPRDGDRAQAIELSQRISKAETLIDDFDIVQTDIEVNTDSDVDQIAEREVFEDRLHSTMATAKSSIEKIDKKECQTSNNSSLNTSDVCHAIDYYNAILSEIKVPKFNGSYDTWYPGSLHDAAIWIVSNLREFSLENFHNARYRHTWLLAIPATLYNHFHSTPPGADPNTPDGRYTESHVRTRNVVERCIGVLKAYFRCLRKDRVLHYKPDIAAKMIYACAILHNILRERKIIDSDLEHNIEDGIENGQDGGDGRNGDDGQNGENLQEVDLLREAREIRNNLILQVFA
ncbi:hypothetical protein JTB14_000002 [Gonioctena quinquepunctata]|nr:hypothetical protein JTB14_000002 [Gonioctena quinquepunctata]